MGKLTKAQRQQIVDDAEAVLEEFAQEPIPPAEELEQMSSAELDAYLEARGVRIDWERVEADVRASLGSNVVQLNRRGGASLDEAQLIELEKRAQRALTSAVRTAANQTLGDLRQQAIIEADGRDPEDQWGMWIAAGENSCPSCIDRHHTVRRMDLWEGDMPRDGTTVCGGNCHCVVVPCANPGRDNEGRRL